MSKLNYTKISYKIALALGILALLAFGLAFIPMEVAAYQDGTNVSFGGVNQGNITYGYNTYTRKDTNTNSVNNNYSTSVNPAPTIYTVSPNSLPPTNQNIVIAISGHNFVPASQVKFNNSYRPTTYLDSDHLTATLYATDLDRSGNNLITVDNPAPGGGTSNAVYLYVNPSAQNNINTPTAPDETYSGLAANALYGSSGKFMPSGLTQWIMIAILILLAVILIRKIYGADKRYHEAPMKHL